MKPFMFEGIDYLYVTADASGGIVTIVDKEDETNRIEIMSGDTANIGRLLKAAGKYADSGKDDAVILKPRAARGSKTAEKADKAK